MPDLLKAAGQDVLQEAADELERVKGHFPPAVRAATAIRKRHLTVIARDDPPVADGDAKDIRGQVLQRGSAVANRLGNGLPSLAAIPPDRPPPAAGAIQGIAELGAKEDRQGFHGKEEVSTRR